MFAIFRTALTVEDLLEELFRNPVVQLGLVCTISAAITLPFAVALAVRLWRQLRLRRLHKEQLKTKAKSKPASESAADDNDGGHGMAVGCFNSKIIETLYHMPLDADAGGNSLEKVALLTDQNQDEHSSSANDAVEAQANAKAEGKGKKKKKHVKILAPEKPADDRRLKSYKRATKADNSDEDGDGEDLEWVGVDAEQKPWKIVTEPDEATAKALKNLEDTGLHGKLATAQLRAKTSKIEQSMSDEERRKESEIRQAQLNAIYQMMQNQGNKFGLNDKDDLVEQMKLYNV